MLTSVFDPVNGIGIGFECTGVEVVNAMVNKEMKTRKVEMQLKIVAGLKCSIGGRFPKDRREFWSHS